jgi:hypothetical protein
MAARIKTPKPIAIRIKLVAPMIEMAPLYGSTMCAKHRFIPLNCIRDKFNNNA